MAAFEQTPLSYAIGIALFVCGAGYLGYVFYDRPPPLELIQFSCRGNPGTPDAYITGTLHNITEDPVEVFIEVELYMERREVKIFMADIDGGNIIGSKQYARFDVIGPGMNGRTENCGVRFKDSNNKPVLIHDRTR